ncbi:MAG TPA: lytic transglycosylase domain-containing protein [Verrucomicrobiae bacterium]|nr:lytic transglycosylase domain-containing protein [Verrucomicrobiae bacterium]
MTRRRASSRVRLGNWLTLALVAAAIGSAAAVYLRWLYREQRYNKLIEQIAMANGVDKFLVKAVIKRESQFDPFAYGTHGEIGLMQVTEGAGREWARATGRRDFGRDLLWDEQANIEAGTWYLARALRRWQDRDDPIPFALAEYNAGLGNALRWLPYGRDTSASQFIEAITFSGTRRYIETITDYYQAYKADGVL